MCLRRCTCLDHCAGVGVALGGILRELDATRLAPATGVYLGLHHDGPSDPARDRFRFRGRRGDVAVGNRNARGLEHGPSLVFVQIHRDLIGVKSAEK